MARFPSLVLAASGLWSWAGTLERLDGPLPRYGACRGVDRAGVPVKNAPVGMWSLGGWEWISAESAVNGVAHGLVRPSAVSRPESWVMSPDCG